MSFGTFESKGELNIVSTTSFVESLVIIAPVAVEIIKPVLGLLLV